MTDVSPPDGDLTPPLTVFGADLRTQQLNLRNFVDEGAGIERSLLDDAVGQLFLGSTAWIEKMRALIESKPRSAEHPEAQRLAGRPSVAKIIEVVTEVFDRSEEAIRAGHGGVERKIVSWLGCYEGMRRLRGIAEALRLRSTSRVSAMIAECDRDLKDDPALRVAVDCCLERLKARCSPEYTLRLPPDAGASISL